MFQLSNKPASRVMSRFLSSLSITTRSLHMCSRSHGFIRTVHFYLILNKEQISHVPTLQSKKHVVKTFLLSSPPQRQLQLLDLLPGIYYAHIRKYIHLCIHEYILCIIYSFLFNNTSWRLVCFSTKTDASFSLMSIFNLYRCPIIYLNSLLLMDI